MDNKTLVIWLLAIIVIVFLFSNGMHWGNKKPPTGSVSNGTTSGS